MCSLLWIFSFLTSINWCPLHLSSAIWIQIGYPDISLMRLALVHHSGCKLNFEYHVYLWLWPVAFSIQCFYSNLPFAFRDFSFQQLGWWHIIFNIKVAILLVFVISRILKKTRWWLVWSHQHCHSSQIWRSKLVFIWIKKIRKIKGTSNKYCPSSCFDERFLGLQGN